jgi:hypothetical protein
MSKIYSTLPIQYGLKPPEGPRAVRLVFTINSGIPDTYQGSLQQIGLSFVQTIFIDNSANAQTVTIAVEMTDQVIEVFPMTQVIVPLLLPAGNFKLTCTAVGNAVIPCQLINVVVQPTAYASGAVAAVTVSGTAAVSLAAVPSTWVDFSVALTAASAQIIPANVNRKGLYLQLSNNANVGALCYFTITGATALIAPTAGNAAIELNPGEFRSYDQWPPIGTQAVKAIGNSSAVGAYFIAWELS